MQNQAVVANLTETPGAVLIVEHDQTQSNGSVGSVARAGTHAIREKPEGRAESAAVDSARQAG